MTLDVRFVPEARDELRAAMNWYDSERPGLGEDLLTEVETTLEYVVRWPEIAHRLPIAGSARHVRRAAVRRFPFGLVYVVIDNSLWVIAVAHGRRRPFYWRDRVDR